jgi:hypothetical protein
MKPWTARKSLLSALKNADVHIGERITPSGALRGLYAARAFKTGDFVASFHGNIITRKELVGLGETNRPLFDRINEYAAATPDHRHIYPIDLDAKGAHLINHSCGPNAKFDLLEHGALLVRALRPIASGDEVTIHYGWVGVKAAMEKSWHPCSCRTPYCTGNIELKIEFLDYDDGTCGPYLPPEEVKKRFLADIINDTDVNEDVLYGYMENSFSMIHGAQSIAEINRDAFFNKLRDGAAEAIVEAGNNYPKAASARRIVQLTKRYDIWRPS